MATFNKKQHEIITKQVKHTAETMGLADWSITVSLEMLDEDSGNTAEAHITNDSSAAEIWLCHGWPDKTPDDALWTVVHELMHLHTHRMSDHVDKLIYDRFSPFETRLAWSFWTSAHETTVDNIARHWSGMMDPGDGYRLLGQTPPV